MEAEAQKLQDTLGPEIAVYLGSEWLVRQPTLPHVVVIPGNASYGPPDGEVRGALASVQLQETYVCKAALFEEAALLAEACYTALATGQRADMRLGSEVWGDYMVRTAALTVTYPASLSNDAVTRVRVETFTQLAEFTNMEVPNGTEENNGSPTTGSPSGATRFLD